MSAIRSVRFVRPNVPLSSVAILFVLVLAIGAIEAMLFFGNLQYTIWSYSLLLVALSLVPLFIEREASLFQAFALLPVFRLVNLTMPVFFDVTLLWLPLVYGPLIPVFVYLGRRASTGDHAWPHPDAPSDSTSPGIGRGLPWWLGGTRGGQLRRLVRGAWRSLAVPDDASTARAVFQWIARGLLVVVLPLVIVAALVSLLGLTVYLAEIEFDIITPKPLISSFDVSQLALLTITMVGFVGFVEELLFRGIIQQVLERRYGLVPGLLFASVVFALMHSGYGVPMEIVFAFAVGLLFGIVYDVTESLVLVSGMHGLLNVLVYGVIPLDGGSSTDLLRAVAVRELNRVGMGGVVDLLPPIDVWMVVGSF